MTVSCPEIARSIEQDQETKQQRWRRRNIDKHRASHHEYMQKYRS